MKIHCLNILNHNPYVNFSNGLQNLTICGRYINKNVPAVKYSITDKDFDYITRKSYFKILLKK